MPLSEVEAAFAKRNPRRHDVKTIAASIEAHGFNAPPLLNEKGGKLVYGHGRTKAARWLYDQDPDKVPDRIARSEHDGEWMIPVLRGVPLTKNQAEEYLVADNRTSERARWEPEGHAAILERIRSRGRLHAVGYTDRRVANMLEKIRKEVKGPSAKPLRYQVVVDCESQEQQKGLLDEMAEKGLVCRPVVS